jgi:LPS-assembly protein
VGRVGFSYDIAQIDYRFRLDKETFSPKRSEVTTGLALDPVYLSTTYLLLDNDPVFADREQVSGSMTIKLTDQWQWNVGGSTDLNNNVDVGATTGLIFQNECTMLSLQAARNFTRDRDVRPETSISFIYALKNLE